MRLKIFLAIAMISFSVNISCSQESVELESSQEPGEVSVSADVRPLLPGGGVSPQSPRGQGTVSGDADIRFQEERKAGRRGERGDGLSACRKRWPMISVGIFLGVTLSALAYYGSASSIPDPRCGVVKISGCGRCLGSEEFSNVCMPGSNLTDTQIASIASLCNSTRVTSYQTGTCWKDADESCQSVAALRRELYLGCKAPCKRPTMQGKGVTMPRGKGKQRRR